MNLGKRIKERRIELGLTLEEVGNIVGVGKSTILRYESGNIGNMGRDKVALLAKALNVSPLWIMGIEEEVDNTPTEKESTSELKQYFDNNMDKLEKLSDEDKLKLIKLIDVYLD